MNGGYAMIDFAGVTSGTNAELANQIKEAIRSEKLIIGYNINGQSPVILIADSNGVLRGGDVTISVSGTTVAITGAAIGAVISDIRKITGTKEQAITAGNVQTIVVPLTIPTGYEIIGVGKIVPSGVGSVISLALRGYQQTSTGLTVYFSNSGSNTGTATVDVEVIIAKIQGSSAKFTPDDPVGNERKVRTK